MAGSGAAGGAVRSPTSAGSPPDLLAAFRTAADLLGRSKLEPFRFNISS